MRRKLTIVALEQSIKGRVRLYKMASSVYKTKIFDDMFFFGLHKNENTKELPYVKSEYLAKLNNKNTFTRVRTLIIFWMNLVKKIVKDPEKNNKIYWALGFEVALPIMFLKKIFKRIDYIYDNADDFSDSNNFNKLTFKIVRKLEVMIIKNSLKNVIPGKSRLRVGIENNYVLKNSPLLSDLDESEKITDQFSYLRENNEKKILLYCNGYLSTNRGLETIKKILVHLENDVKIIIAGKKNNDLDSLLMNPYYSRNIIYLGNLSTIESLAVYKNIDLCLVFYDPKIEINRKAEPNKIGDCLLTNTPFIANSEIETLDYLKNESIGFYTKYNDYNETISLLKNLNYIEIKKMQIQISNLKGKKIWDNQVIDLFEEIKYDYYK